MTTDVHPFAALGLSEGIVSAVAALGYEEPTPIQKAAIPLLLEGRDLLGLAATGTGKTAAFALPMIHRIAANPDRKGTSALVLCPTRELAVQVSEAIGKYGAALGIRVLAVYGGQPITRQLRGFDRRVDVVVATPGRALDHLKRGTLKLGDIQTVVLDEADEMLDMGFAEDLEAILSDIPKPHQTALFSATMAPRISQIAARHLSNPAKVAIDRELVPAGQAPRVRHSAYLVLRAHKVAALARVLELEVPTAALVFCRTRTEVDELTQQLLSRGLKAEALHGGLSQDQRDRVMKKFRSGQANLLVATDVAARGLDIEQVSHVVNYDVPSAPEVYVHRVGRTGRAGREGVALTLLEPRERRLLGAIGALLRRQVDVATLPSAGDLQTRRIESTRAELEGALADAGTQRFAAVVEQLREAGHDLATIAAAALARAHTAAGRDRAIEDIPHVEIHGPKLGAKPGQKPYADVGPAGNRPTYVPPPAHRNPFSAQGGREGFAPRSPGVKDGFAPRSPKEGFASKGKSFDAPPAFGTATPGTGKRVDKAAEKGDRPPRHFEAPPARPLEGAARAPRAGTPSATRLFFGVGAEAGVRPGDLVGAICNETGLDVKSIGSIQIADRFSLVEVPNEIADELVNLLQRTFIKGKRAKPRREK